MKDDVFKSRSSTKLLTAIAALYLIIGVILLVAALISMNLTLCYIGISLFVVSIPLFITANLADDVHYLTYEMETQIDCQQEYNKQAIKIMKQICTKLSNIETGADKQDTILKDHDLVTDKEMLKLFGEDYEDDGEEEDEQ